MAIYRISSPDHDEHGVGSTIVLLQVVDPFFLFTPAAGVVAAVAEPAPGGLAADTCELYVPAT